MEFTKEDYIKEVRVELDKFLKTKAMNHIKTLKKKEDYDSNLLETGVAIKDDKTEEVIIYDRKIILTAKTLNKLYKQQIKPTKIKFGKYINKGEK